MKPSLSKSLKTAGGKKRSREEAAGVSAAPESQPRVEKVEGEDGGPVGTAEQWISLGEGS
jgi:hypothetical protein